MLTSNRNWLLAAMIGLLVACSGGGGGDSASGVEPGPPSPGEPVEPPPPGLPSPAPYADAEELFAYITSVTIPEDGRPVIEWQLTDGRNVAITDLEPDNVRFTLAKLQNSPLGNFTGTWQSYINDIEEPAGIGPGTENKLQADYERGDTNPDEFTNNGDGTYRYRFAANIKEPDEKYLTQAETEGLDLSYQASLTHRAAMQFDGSNDTANPHWDWRPSDGTTEGLFTMDIAATANCNRCHDELAVHGPNRREIKYCVTCHNTGSTDSDSGNTVDFKVMVHKIHRGKDLPSVVAGGEYIIWGYQGSEHNYSNVAYPQDIRNCVNCHAGSQTGAGLEDTLQLTPQGDNWAEVPTRAACGSCHDDVNFDRHKGGQPDDSKCASCHESAWTQSAHVNPVAEARKEMEAIIEHVDNTMPGDFPMVTFRIRNPLTGEDYDLKNDPKFTHEETRLEVGISWDTTDYTNTGNEGDNASQVQTFQAVANSSDNGDGTYTVTMPVAVPDGSKSPGVAANGTGTATVEGHPIFELDTNGDGVTEPTAVPVGDAHKFFSINEADGEVNPRRVAVDLKKNCLTCHDTLTLHGSNRADNIDSCVTCHNARNTDLRQRLEAKDPPTDGKREESVDFKTMVHGIHAASMRENALEIVGFGGFTTHRYTTDTVHYPGNLATCTSCHTEDGFRLPLDPAVLGTTIDTGGEINDPADDTVVSPASAVCSSCHDEASDISHMEFYDGNFSTTQAAIDSGEVIEQCNTCHGTGKPDDVAEVHGLD